MRKIFVSATTLLLLSVPAIAADNMGMSMSGPKPGAMAASSSKSSPSQQAAR